MKRLKYKICRRLGSGVYEKCQTQKFALSEAKHRPRGGGKIRRSRSFSDFARQLFEKQKIRYAYGLNEKQFSNYIKGAMRGKEMKPAEKLWQSLESRLDNVVYRLGLAESRVAARQMVSHGHFLVNGRRVKIPSYMALAGDLIKIREGSKEKKIFSNLSKKLKDYVFPEWLSFDSDKTEGKVKEKPRGEDSFLKFGSVFEFYSR